ncbi:MAG: UDP-N-acetylmuramate dehydrogenase [Emergencia sp.]|nr:UDP-N-acetylmuramate dehydrogenase [Emergencia sp.]
MKRFTYVEMKDYTSFKTGGRATEMIMPASAWELQGIIMELTEQNMPYHVIGNGTNTLVTDPGYHGTIIKMDEAMSEIKVKGDRLICQAGALMRDVAQVALENELTGFEFASGIPGSIGGAVFMNAGAYDGEMKDIVDTVSLVSPDGEYMRSMYGDKLDFGYRYSKVQETKEIITAVTLKLKKGDRKEIEEKMKELAEQRAEKQPTEPSAGSFFKRPEGHFAGKLIDEAGLRGVSVGGAQVSEKHCGFIVNKGGATTSDIIELMHLVQNTVEDKFGVKLEPEVRIIGEK